MNSKRIVTETSWWHVRTMSWSTRMAAGTAESLYRDQSSGIFSKHVRTLSSQGVSIFKNQIVTFLSVEYIMNVTNIQSMKNDWVIDCDYVTLNCWALGSIKQYWRRYLVNFDENQMMLKFKIFVKRYKKEMRKIKTSRWCSDAYTR